MLKQIKYLWMNFWGQRYRVYKNNDLIKEILIYHKRIYIEDLKK